MTFIGTSALHQLLLLIRVLLVGCPSKHAKVSV